MSPIIIPVAGVRLVLACVHSDLGLTSAESASRVLDLLENLQFHVINLKPKVNSYDLLFVSLVTI